MALSQLRTVHDTVLGRLPKQPQTDQNQTQRQVLELWGDFGVLSSGQAMGCLPLKSVTLALMPNSHPRKRSELEC